MHTTITSIHPRWIVSLCLLLFLTSCASYDLHRAIKTNDEATARQLIEQHKGINSRDSRGATPLMYAAHYDHPAMAGLLIRNGAQLDAHNKSGVTALMLASKRGNLAVAEVLMAAGASVAASSEEGWTALHYAARYGKEDEQEATRLVRLLLANGASIDARTEAGLSPLMLSCWGRNTGISELLIENGATITAADDLGRSPIHHAAASCDWETVRSIGTPMSNINESDHEGFNPLMYASRYGAREDTPEEACAKTAEFFLERGAPVSSRTDDGWTALLLASRYGNQEIVPLLIHHGADVTLANPFGYMAAHLAAYGQHPEIIAELLKAGVGVDTRIDKEKAGRFYGKTPLYLAAYYDHRDCVRALLEAGATATLEEKDLHDIYAQGIVHFVLSEIQAGENPGKEAKSLKRALAHLEEAEALYREKAKDYRTRGTVGHALLAALSLGEYAYQTKTGKYPVANFSDMNPDTSDLNRAIEVCEARAQECRKLISECERRIKQGELRTRIEH